MKRSLLLFWLSSLALLSARAGPDPAIIGEDSHWAIYLDCQALRASPLGGQLFSRLIQRRAPTADGELRLNYQKIWTTLRSATAYGVDFSRDPRQVDGTVVLQGTRELRPLAEGLLAEETVTHPERVSDCKDPALPFAAYLIGGKLIVGFPPEPIILIAKSRERLLRAREVFRRRAASLATSRSAPLAGLWPKASASYLIAASVRPDEGFLSQQGLPLRLLQLANSGTLEIGEAGPNLAAHVRLTATSEELADKMAKIVQGMAVIMSFAETSDPSWSEFWKTVTVGQDHQTVTLESTCPSARVLELINGSPPPPAVPVPP